MQACRAALLATGLALAGSGGGLAQPATSAAPQDLSPIGLAAAQRGVRTCLPRVDALARDLSAKYDVGVYLFNRLENPDASLFSLSMELTPSPSGDPFYVSASFAPVGGACQVLVESTIVWRSGCMAVGLAYPGFQLAGSLLRDIRSLAANGPERLFLMPSGPDACISIEKAAYF